MNADKDMLAWPERNQQWLTQRFTAWRARIEGAGRQPPIEEEDDEAGGFEPAARRLATLFGLSGFETDLLVLAAGADIDAGLRQAIGARPSLALALGLLPQPHWDALSTSGPLRHWLLLHVEGPFGQAAPLRIDERVLHFLTGVSAFDEKLIGIARPLAAPSESLIPPLAPRMAAAMAGLSRPLLLLPDALLDAGRRSAALELAAAGFAQAGLQTLWIDAGALPAEARELAEIARRIDREAALSQAGLALAFDTEAQAAATTLRLVAALRSPLALLGAPSPLQLADAAHERQVLRFRLPPARAALRTDLPAAVQQAQQQFHVEPAVLAQVLAQADEGDDGAIWQGLREAARGGLDALAQRLDSQAGFEDLVLPPLVMAQLREIAAQLGQRQRVYEDWGFGEKQSRGLGIAALFAGESGTGKTLAAEAIANEARLDLYRIDLASVVSKYIGETEKNLARLFDAAERSGAVLLFDEADALFGKRSEVKDSHDRYANIEVAYLLQRIESYRGLAILTSNLKSALDRAFLRRIRFVVQFPFPDEAAREAVWRRQFPPRAPVAGDVDCVALAKLPLSGGHIRSVALNAAFQAAAKGEPIGQGVLMQAARAEFAKLERQLPGGLS